MAAHATALLTHEQKWSSFEVPHLALDYHTVGKLMLKFFKAT